ncbi:n-terminal binuclear Zn cluster-containing protein [Fusarium coicis]|nr:n-terminal binuclear Zn cluster-containing protein [Fusarium coicis]
MSQGLHPKPMRLGTRSCAQCRRRKVRCVFPTEQRRPPCQQCALRSIPCLAQQPAAQEAMSPGDSSPSEEARLDQRLAEIETNVRDIRTRLTLTGTSPSVTELLPAGPSTTFSMANNAGAETDSMADVEIVTHATTPDESGIAYNVSGFQDAPLLTLVKAASMTEGLQSNYPEPTTRN